LIKLITGGSILGVPFLDPLAGLLVSGMILKAGIETGYERYIAYCFTYKNQNSAWYFFFYYYSFVYVCSVMELVDAAIEVSVLQPIKETIIQVEGVKVET
jgi:divalent metal cation (Fe/Co/Zn/Cd) transporter